MLAKAGIPREITGFQNATIHSFRRTFATEIQKPTGDVAETASLLGHSDISTTAVDLHTAGIKSAEATPRLGESMADGDKRGQDLGMVTTEAAEEA